MHVRELSEGDRHRLLMHFLALDASARLLRFGIVFPDELITTYVQQNLKMVSRRWCGDY